MTWDCNGRVHGKEARSWVGSGKRDVHLCMYHQLPLFRDIGSPLIVTMVMDEAQGFEDDMHRMSYLSKFVTVLRWSAVRREKVDETLCGILAPANSAIQWNQSTYGVSQ